MSYACPLCLRRPALFGRDSSPQGVAGRPSAAPAEAPLPLPRIEQTLWNPTAVRCAYFCESAAGPHRFQAARCSRTDATFVNHRGVTRRGAPPEEKANSKLFRQVWSVPPAGTLQEKINTNLTEFAYTSFRHAPSCCHRRCKRHQLAFALRGWKTT